MAVSQQNIALSSKNDMSSYDQQDLDEGSYDDESENEEGSQQAPNANLKRQRKV